MKESGIVFFFEENDIDVWSGRNIDLDAWNYNCKIGGIKKVIIINKTSLNIPKFDIDMDIQIVDKIPALSGHVTQLVLPHENIKNNISLWEYNHDTDWYVFGPASGWNSDYFADSFVFIPQNGEATHHSIFIGATLMFHRFNVLNY